MRLEVSLFEERKHLIASAAGVVAIVAKATLEYVRNRTAGGGGEKKLFFH